ILEDRGVRIEELKMTGNFVNITYDIADEQHKSFIKNSKITFGLYISIILITILPSVLSINLETLGFSATILKLSAYICYVIFLVKSFLNQSKFYRSIGEEYEAEGALFYLFLGMPFYLFMYFYFRNEMKEKMTGIK